MNRVAKWDNAKAILIYCVVLGHFVAAYQDKAAVYRSVFFFLYLFHMPGFFLISGLFSKRFANEERLNGRKFVPLLILCLVGIFLRFLSRVIF
ncbi:MAG: acyltransferase family protein, partial [Clostridiales bacterium]|nr:acyltransferase family protein [Clostridiales bacterium]